VKVTNEWLLDKERVGTRAEKLFDAQKATIHGEPLPSSCTVSFQVVDEEGNAISFVNSNFMGFGTGIVPEGCGFTLQNRGFGFCREAGHPNCLEGGKRPYHTIIPGMLTHADTGDLYATISNMGGFMQPVGHLQLTVDMVAGGLDPQAAVDMPRFCIACGTQTGTVHLEDGIADDVIEELRLRGHKMRPGISGFARSIFGRAQIIKRDRKTGVLWAGSDGRADGCAMGF
jgi:gamma-glutamyltranspeptidase/glutathione hydrolase